MLAATPGINLSTGTQLTTYTLALATTAEFTQAAGGKGATQALLEQFVGEINKIYEPELAILFQLHPQNVKLIFENAATDGYSNGDAQRMVMENPAVVNRALNGSATNDAGYDFGHVLGIGQDAGFAGTATKASGGSNLGMPTIETRFVEFVGHEIGHQLGADHIQNGIGTNCRDNRNSATAVEPGSGSSIMGYQGTCASDDLPELAGDGTYFHAVSFDDIVRYTTTVVPQRGTKVSTGNALPTFSAGADRKIPAATPFALTATGSDPNPGDRLTYSWEQIDPGGAVGVAIPIANSQDQTGPLFRSYAPTTLPTRLFPRLEELLVNTPASQNKNDHLPTQNRDLNFRVTVRDNHLFNGRPVSGVSSDDVKLTVVNTGAPFQVNSFNGPNQPLAGGSPQTVTWNVAGTDANGINTTKVDIWLSVDGGRTFPLKLASQTNNDGSETVKIPNVQVAQARIKVQADPSQNVFFDINDSDFGITQQTTVSGGIIVTESGGGTSIAEGLFAQTGLAANDNYTIALTQPPTGPVTVTITTDPQTQVSINGSNFAASQQVTFAAGDASAKTVTVKAVDDSVGEGTHAGVVRQAVTSSSDPNFSSEVLIGEIVATVAATISDDEAPPIIGVELDYGNVAPTTPLNWNRIEDPFQTRLTNLKRESGDSTPIDFAIGIANPIGGGWSDRTLDTNTVPAHSPSLASVGDVMFWENSAVTVTWSDLRPNAKYRVYVIAASEVIVDNVAPINQTISITGSGVDNPAPFVQDGTGKITGQGPGRFLQLLINGAVGNRGNPLEQYAQVVTSTADRKVTIQVTPAAGGSAALSALAIQEFLEPAPSILVNETNGTTLVSESGTTDTFSVTLEAPPATNVVLNLASGNSAEVTVDKPLLTFTPQNWNTPQVVTVTGVDDPLVDGDQLTGITVSVNAAQSESLYANSPDKTVAVTNQDNEIPGFNVTETAGTSEVTEGGTTDTIAVVLSVAPLSNVVLQVVSGNPSEASAAPGTLTFTPANWDQPQIVTLTAVDDQRVDGNTSANVTVSVQVPQSNPAFAGVASRSVTATIRDNDQAGFTVTESGGNTQVNELGSTDSFTVLLAKQPLADVVISVASGSPGQATVDKKTITFTTANWDVPQTVTVTGIQDGQIDGDQVIAVTLAVDAAKSQPQFAALAAQTVAVVVVDSGVTRPWLNTANRLDVSGDGNVVPNDALRIINELNDPKYRNALGQLPEQRPSDTAFYDVNGDGFVTPNDALQVINFLNSVAVPEGESRSSEAVWADLAGAWFAWRQLTSDDADFESVLAEIATDLSAITK